MNVTQSFDEFAKAVTATDLALYAGAALILMVIFKDQLNPVQKFIMDLLNSIKTNISTPKVVVKEPEVVVIDPNTVKQENKDLFFSLVLAWKQTRDLAAQSKCQKAVEVADQMFPYLSPTVCNKVQDEKQ